MAIPILGAGEAEHADDVLIADCNSWSARHADYRRVGAIIGGHEVELNGIGALSALRRAWRDDPVGSPDRPRFVWGDPNSLGGRQADDAHTAHFQAGERQTTRQFSDRQVEIDVFAQPG